MRKLAPVDVIRIYVTCIGEIVASFMQKWGQYNTDGDKLFWLFSWKFYQIASHKWKILLCSFFFGKRFRIKTSDKTTFRSPWDHFQVVEKANKIYIYKYKLGHEVALEPHVRAFLWPLEFSSNKYQRSDLVLCIFRHISLSNGWFSIKWRLLIKIYIYFF